MSGRLGRRPAPAGFRFLTICALFCATATAVVLMRPLPHGAGLVRLPVAAIGALALTTAEALAFVRPWALKATAALAAAFPVAGVVLTRSVPEGIAASGPGLLFGVVALAIVHHGLASAQRPANQPDP